MGDGEGDGGEGTRGGDEGRGWFPGCGKPMHMYVLRTCPL